MVKKIFGLFLVVFLLVFVAASSYAVIKGLDREQQSMVKVGDAVVVPEGAEVESAVSVGGSVTVYGHVLKDAVSVGGNVILKDSSIVDGNAVSVGGTVTKDTGAVINGDVVEVNVPGISPAMVYFTKGNVLKGMAIFGLLSFIGFLVLAIILVAMFTPQLGRVSSVVEGDLWKNFLVGLLIAILFIPSTLLLVVSIIGIFFIPIWIALLAAAFLFGYLAFAHFLGKKVLNLFRFYGKSMMVETVTGVILLALVALVPIGGPLVKAIAGLCGLGGVYWTRFGTK